MAAKVEIYTWRTCPFCIRAKSLLSSKGIDFIEYCIDGDETARAKMAQRANKRRSVPQITMLVVVMISTLWKAKASWMSY
jgi:glutaredoxin 3